MAGVNTSAAVSDHLCECGCGQFTTLIAKTAAAQGRIKGEPNRFVYGHARGWEHPNPRKPWLTDEQRAASAERTRVASNRRRRKGRRYLTPEQRLAARRARQPRYQEKRRAQEMARRARKRGAHIEHVEPLVVLERDDGACGICGGDVDPTFFHVDHIVALADGGDHSYANVQTAHPRCNLRKGGGRHRHLDV
jgi:5-methylcytosine-specific restriction endonuclease McrA